MRNGMMNNYYKDLKKGDIVEIYYRNNEYPYSFIDCIEIMEMYPRQQRMSFKFSTGALGSLDCNKILKMRRVSSSQYDEPEESNYEEWVEE